MQRVYLPALLQPGPAHRAKAYYYHILGTFSPNALTSLHPKHHNPPTSTTAPPPRLCHRVSKPRPANASFPVSSSHQAAAHEPNPTPRTAGPPSQSQTA
ncbi:uncharacterized protein K452DRAFT_103058 [Aplosporella prunicola CBS 121167]|uniref:Uncharacterized protein n=1 Tax=Aplosporella prunicola CBS 121167 TaxID=1176127 RepID=A0A6A6BTF9_9PEZI|nr:uncharacterized protein K452DRAFT_103058 [Aplosporella prunicola CBS 121167]KAF2145901.1 hypothetical protein K452DRAFT_103058 [Aplosporella prunicola CBS 121167]